jgi:hypothetical protein
MSRVGSDAAETKGTPTASAAAFPKIPSIRPRISIAGPLCGVMFGQNR